ncbi:acyltransferase [Taibaiella koreensis]|uniref:acyltransferase n=1 Tax=Taibaiella koreensis TaxID=1268548 RepID=UPI000E59CB77|nr:acyltransferase [Taibaiella koreensis]
MRLRSFFFNECKGSFYTMSCALFSLGFYRIFRQRNIIAKQRTRIKGISNITTGGLLSIGLTDTGFAHSRDLTFLNIRGQLAINGRYSFGSGCRIDIGPNGSVRIGNGGYTNVNTRFVIKHELVIGEACVISWDCQFLDDDYHELTYPDKRVKEYNGIQLGDHVWVGNGTKIYKGTIIPDGCIVAADSVVRGAFTTKNALIAGNPARVIKENVSWQ